MLIDYVTSQYKFKSINIKFTLYLCKKFIKQIERKNIHMNTKTYNFLLIIDITP